MAKQAKNSKVKQKNIRTQEEIKRQIEGLEKMKTWLPEYSGLGTPNHELIDVQISIIDGSSELSDIDEGDFEEMDAQNEVYNQENTKGSVNVDKWQKAIDYLSKLMEQVETDGFGSFDDVDAVPY